MDEIVKINRITALYNMKLLVEFKNGVIKIYDTKKLLEKYDFFEPLKDPNIFTSAFVDYDGSGIIWNSDLDISEWELWENGVEVPLTVEDFDQFYCNNSIGTAEVCKLLNCSRQNVDFLTKTGKIHPVLQLKNNKLFSKADIMAYKFKAENIAYAKTFDLGFDTEID